MADWQKIPAADLRVGNTISYRDNILDVERVQKLNSGNVIINVKNYGVINIPPNVTIEVFR